MEADLLRVYGLDVHELGSPRLRWDRLASLLKYLPPDAATVVAVNGASSQWGATEYLLALVVDALNVANWQRTADKKAPRPTPVPRPGEIEQRSARRTRLTPEQVKQRLRRQLAARQREAVTDGA